MEQPCLLVELFEEVAKAMRLDEGAHRLELLFSGGHLRSWYAHAERRAPGELGRFDVAIAPLLDRVRATARG